MWRMPFGCGGARSERINSGCSLSSVRRAVGVRRIHQLVPPVITTRFHMDARSRAPTTMQPVTDGVCASVHQPPASIYFRPAPPSAVGRHDDVAARIVDPVFSGIGEKAPNTMECVAPMRAQASIAIASSGISGM